MTNKMFFLIFCSCLLSLVVQAQHRKVLPPSQLAQKNAAKKSGIQQATFKGIVNAKPNLPDWHVKLTSHSISHTEEEEPQNEAWQKRQLQKEARKYTQVFGKQKIQPPLLSANKQESAQESNNLYLGASFEGNITTNWYPPDNHLAISNGGIIVSVINSQLSYFNSNGTLLSETTFANLFSSFDLSNDLFDPRVLYDEVSDRFIMLILNDRTPANSKILLCFSITNNPSNGWYLYELSGNPLNNNSWFDYPSVGLSQNELYISGNAFASGFDQALIYQIKKADGYTGTELSYQYWYDLAGNPFTLAPLSWGQAGSYGPGAYFIATQSANEGSSVKFYDLTDDLDNNPDFVYYNITTDYFERGSNAYQPGSSNKMRTNGSVVRSAFYLDGVVHYAFAMDRQSGSPDAAGWNGIAYNRLDVATASNTRYVLWDNDIDLAYPGIASSGATETDQAISMVYLASSNTLYPEMRVVNIDNNLNPTSPILVKAGVNTVTVGCDGGSCRWGDYTGAQRQYNTASVWILGQAPKNNGNWRNWIAQVTPEAVGINPTIPTTNTLTAYPNPVVDLLNIDFDQTETAYTQIYLYDMYGKPVKLLYAAHLPKGKQTLSFNKQALPTGMYLLNITQNGQTNYRAKVVVF